MGSGWSRSSSGTVEATCIAFRGSPQRGRVENFSAELISAVIEPPSGATTSSFGLNVSASRLTELIFDLTKPLVRDKPVLSATRPLFSLTTSPFALPKSLTRLSDRPSHRTRLFSVLPRQIYGLPASPSALTMPMTLDDVAIAAATAAFRRSTRPSGLTRPPFARDGATFSTTISANAVARNAISPVRPPVAVDDAPIWGDEAPLPAVVRKRPARSLAALGIGASQEAATCRPPRRAITSRVMEHRFARNSCRPAILFVALAAATALPVQAQRSYAMRYDCRIAEPNTRQAGAGRRSSCGRS